MERARHAECAAPPRIRIAFIDAHGVRHEIETRAGGTAMQLALAHGIAGIDAICGGNCSCGTCRVIVDPRWLAHLAPASADEIDVLEGTGACERSSRLGCRIAITAAMAVFGGMLDRCGRFVASVPPGFGAGTSPARLAAGFDARFRRVFRAHAPPRWQFAWHGVVGMVADRVPRLCRIGPDALAAVGYSGAGIALAIAYGRRIADLLVGAADEAGPIPGDVPALPLTRTVPWVFRHLVAPLARALAPL